MNPPRIGLALVTCLTLAACAPTAVPSPTPSALMCTPEFGGDPFTCTPNEFDQHQLLDARYAQAERVLRRNVELENEMYHAQTGELAAETIALHDPDGPYLAHMIRVARVATDVRVEGDFEITSVTRTPIEEADAPGTIALITCIDASRTEFFHPDGSVGIGTSGAKKVVFTETSGLLIWNAFDTEEGAC